MLILVAFATLTQVYVVSTQDVSRLCLTQALAKERLTISPCVGRTLDHARYHGRVYSDKAPGLSILALPAAELTGFPGSHRADGREDLRVWVVRALTSGLLFLLLVVVIGRIAEGIASGAGAAVALAFALGTISGCLSATMFDQTAAAALCFCAFALAWHRRPGFAGLLAGLAMLVEYETGLIVLIIGLYVLSAGWRRFGRYCVCAAPGLALLGAYDWGAFGSPLRASYRFVANGYAREQASGFFGISLPTWHGVTTVLVGDRGVLLTSPVLVAAAVGLGVLARQARQEAVVCASVAVVGLVLEFGYFLPYGGVSPGPRFLDPALPFVVVGLAPMISRARAVVSGLVIVSVAACTALLVTWPNESVVGYRQTVWGEIARALAHSDSRLRRNLTENLLGWVGMSRVDSAIFVVACVAVASAVVLLDRGASGPSRLLGEPRAPWYRPRARAGVTR